MPRRTVDEIADLSRRLYEERIRNLRPGRSLEDPPEPPAPSSGRRIELSPDPPPRRKIAMPRRSVRGSTRRAGGYGEPVYTWAFRSSQPRGGQIITYETRLEEDGTVRCNCPGWIFCKGEPATKTCKHKASVLHEVPELLRAFRAGEQLPVFDDQYRPVNLTGTTTGRISSQTENVSNPPRAEGEARATPGSALRRGRVIQFD